MERSLLLWRQRVCVRLDLMSKTPLHNLLSRPLNRSTPRRSPLLCPTTNKLWAEMPNGQNSSEPTSRPVSMDGISCEQAFTFALKGGGTRGMGHGRHCPPSFSLFRLGLCIVWVMGREKGSRLVHHGKPTSDDFEHRSTASQRPKGDFVQHHHRSALRQKHHDGFCM